MAPITAYVIAHALLAQPAVPHEVRNLAEIRKLQLADPKTDSQKNALIDVLIGGDHYWKVVKDS
jgi:hypothetical protein